MMIRKPFVGGNWKMNGDRLGLSQLTSALQSQLDTTAVDVAIFPSFVYLPTIIQQLEGHNIMVGAQNCCQYEQGAYSGEISAAMLADISCRLVLLGHSERRHIYSENNEQVAEKFVLAQKNQLSPVLCLGETLAQRQANQTQQVVLEQLQSVIKVAGIEALAQSVIAYEPVWAIGTGQTATAEQAQSVHQMLRQHIHTQDANVAKKVRIIYGGSVKADNAEALFAMDDIDGGLIGGAALKADDFAAIVAATHC